MFIASAQKLQFEVYSELLFSDLMLTLFKQMDLEDKIQHLFSMCEGDFKKNDWRVLSRAGQYQYCVDLMQHIYFERLKIKDFT